jgi:hypothetical protein
VEVETMETYRYLQIAYLIVPMVLGVEFFLSAKTERRKEEKKIVSPVFLNAFGYVFSALIPALFLFTIFSLEYKRFPSIDKVFHGLDRYGVMFCYLGAWWQVFLILALRARRSVDQGGKSFLWVWSPYLVFGAFISALVLWVAPWGLMWVSFLWFVATSGFCGLLRVSPTVVSEMFMVLALLIFIVENIFFIILDAIV